MPTHHHLFNYRWRWVGRGWHHTVAACEGQQGVRARVCAAGKALEGDDRQMISFIIIRLSRKEQAVSKK